jgi:uncharacterized Ntn-hydrolase superfamily protein
MAVIGMASALAGHAIGAMFGATGGAQAMSSLSTFSIVAHDPDAHEWGVATQSKFLAVGSVVPWAKAGVGAIATQAHANTSYGPEGLALLAEGLSAQEVLERLTAADPERDHRQAGIVDVQGRAFTFTGRVCMDWAGGITGQYYACQGNILVGEETVQAIAHTFEHSRGELADRLVDALAAGQTAGGDRRGQQSACVVIVREKGGYAGCNDRYLDLRVDDDPQPIRKLKRLVQLHHLYFGRTAPEDWLKIEGKLCRELQKMLKRSGHYTGRLTGQYDEATLGALRALVGIENLEERCREKEALIDRVVVDILRKKFPARSRG